MNFAEFFQKITACVAICGLAACVSQTSPDHSPSSFNRSEAVKARINLALAYLEQNDLPKAKQNIDKALEHDRNDYLPHSVLAYYYQQIGDISQAEQSYQTALSLSEKQGNEKQPRPDVLNNYGTFLCKQGKFEQAYSQFEQALKGQQPYYHQADTLENIALCANRANHRQRQSEALKQLAKFDPARVATLEALFVP
ncbi:MAG: type IV pilus biogenesis/stability protein PilW [Pasteurellaceae bacterium]|nr:type IV pilus biogenesis/stability protein PilW [Pasteurellaceae bacterium]